jgi:hypothetical protein
MCECVRVRASACVCLFCGSDVPRVFHARALLIHARACDLPVPLQKSSDGARVRRRLAGCGDGERSLPDRVPPWCSMARTTCAAPAARATSSGVRDPCLDRVGMCALAPCRSSSFTILVAIRSLQLRSNTILFLILQASEQQEKKRKKNQSSHTRLVRRTPRTHDVIELFFTRKNERKKPIKYNTCRLRRWPPRRPRPQCRAPCARGSRGGSARPPRAAEPARSSCPRPQQRSSARSGSASRSARRACSCAWCRCIDFLKKMEKKKMKMKMVKKKRLSFAPPMKMQKSWKMCAHSKRMLRRGSIIPHNLIFVAALEQRASSAVRFQSSSVQSSRSAAQNDRRDPLNPAPIRGSK